MTFSWDEKIGSGSLEYDKQCDYFNMIAQRIKDNDELMKRITEFCNTEQAANPETKLTVEDRIEMMIDDIADDALLNIRFYIEFDVETREDKFL